MLRNARPHSCRNCASAGGGCAGLLITDPNHVYNLDRTGQCGPVVMQGFTNWAGYIDLQGNSYNSLDCSAITQNNGKIQFRDNAMTSALFTNMTTTNDTIDLWGNPLAGTVLFPALTTMASRKQLYIAHNSTMTGASFASMVTMGGPIVCSQDFALNSFSAPLLVTINDELELDYCKALASLSLPSLTTINYAAGFGLIGLGGDMTDIPGQTNPPQLSSLLLPLLSTLRGGLIVKNCRLLTTFDPSPLTTLGNGFQMDFSRSNLTQAVMDACFTKLASLIAGITSGVVDFRFQFGGQLPSASGQAAAATLVAAGIVNNQGGTTLYA